MHIVKAEIVRSKAANRRRPGVAVVSRQERIRHLLACFLTGLVEHIDLLTGKFRGSIRVCHIGKTNEFLRVVPGVVPGARAGTASVLPLGLGG